MPTIQTARQRPGFIMLLTLISFGSINAVLFTPALPALSSYFHVMHSQAQLTITLFLIGYAVGQLLYGPLANRYGRKAALSIGVVMQLIAAVLCVLSGYLHLFPLLAGARLLLALGSAVGVKMTFTLLSENYSQVEATKIMATIMLAFAIAPALAVALGGYLVSHFSWESCFYPLIIYGLVLLIGIRRLPETSQFQRDVHALRLTHITHNYLAQLKNPTLIMGALLMGCCASFVYLFAAMAPFIAIQQMAIRPDIYGLWNLLSVTGVIAGSLLSMRLAGRHTIEKILLASILMTWVGALIMLLGVTLFPGQPTALFLPMIIVNAGATLLLTNAAMLATSQAQDKAHASAMMNFLNLSMAVLIMFGIGGVQHPASVLLPALFVGLSLLAFLILQMLITFCT